VFLYGLNDFMRANSLQGPLEEVALEMEIFLGPEMAISKTHAHKTTKVPVFLYGRLDLMILMGAHSLPGPLEWVGPTNRDLFGL
jgi:hypothetical protein